MYQAKERYVVCFRITSSLLSLYCYTGSIDWVVDHKEIVYGGMIGRGSFGTVHKGTWKGRKVALKKINIPSGVNGTEMVASSRELNALKYISKPYSH